MENNFEPLLDSGAIRIDKAKTLSQTGTLTISSEGFTFEAKGSILEAKTTQSTSWNEISFLTLTTLSSRRLVLKIQLFDRPSRDYWCGTLLLEDMNIIQELFQRFNVQRSLTSQVSVSGEAVDVVRIKREWDEALVGLGIPIVTLRVIDAGGWGPPIRQEAHIYVLEDGLLVRSNRVAGFSIEIASSAISDVLIESKVASKGGGFIGGGFGLKGAAEGMLEAQVLNWATQRFESWMTVSIRGPEGWLTGIAGYQSSRKAANSDDLLDFKAKLRPIIDLAARPVQIPKVENSSLDLVEQLTRLAELKAAGHITVTEFEIAKRKLLT